MSYTVYLLPSAQRDCDALPGETYRRCREVILKLERDPRPHGCQKLVGEDGYRIRVGDYRLLYRVDDKEKKVFLYRLKHRREVYR